MILGPVAEPIKKTRDCGIRLFLIHVPTAGVESYNLMHSIVMAERVSSGSDPSCVSVVQWVSWSLHGAQLFQAKFRV